MFSLPELEQAQELTARVRLIARFLRNAPTETILVFGALLSAAAGAWLALVDPPKLFADLESKEVWQRINSCTSLALFILAGLLVLWAGLRLWKVLTPGIDTQDVIRPSALKGPIAFGPHDADLFRRLGRETETATLLDWILDNRVGLIILMGESGAGKTSLLRAGLSTLLAKQDPPIDYHYWEAVPEQSSAGFLKAVKAEWTATAEAPVPQKIGDLDKSGQGVGRRVVVLDQLEQLSPAKQEHQPIFRLLRNATKAAPPHRITYIVAFRRDYAPVWLDFQYDQLAGHAPIMMSLRLFNERQSKEIMAIIADRAKFTVDIALVGNLIASMKNDESRISPVDIGITLLALNERALSKPDRHLDKGDYYIAGGATGLLAEYISSRLDRYRPDERSNIVQAMLELADLVSDQRLAEGLLPEELANKVRLPAAAMKRYLNDLASPQVRLLEFLPPSGAYRLSHERLIPALRMLGGVVLAEADQASRMFNRAYSDWVAGRRKRKLLLGGRHLRDVMKYRGQLHWAADRDDREMFLRQSLARRTTRLMTASVVAAILLMAGYLGWEQFNVMQYRRDLGAWRLPVALIDSSQLDSVTIISDRLTHLRWLRCSFRELTLKTPKVDDLEALRDCRNLVSLTLDLRGATIRSLDALKDLKGLTSLTLNLGYSGVSSLDPLKDLKSLTTLTLDVSESLVGSLDPLKDLKGLTTLTLDLGDSEVRNLDALKDLKGLTNVELDPRESKVSSLDPLGDLPNLKLFLYSRDVRSLDALKDLKGLTDLTLSFANSGGRGISNLDVLKDLKGLTTLRLSLDDARVGNLDALKDLQKLTTLTLDLRGSAVSSLEALKEIKGLTNLTLSLGSGVNLDALKDLKDLTTLEVEDFRSGGASSLNVLKDLKGLTALTLHSFSSDVSSLDTLNIIKSLKGLKGISTLSLGLGDIDASSLKALKELKGLTNLTLYLGGSDGSGLEALRELKGLRNLTLHLSNSDINSLDQLRELKGLRNLTLHFGDSDVSSLDPLKDLKGLTILTLDLANTPSGVFNGRWSTNTLGSASSINSLGPLKDLKGVTTLTLAISDATLSDLSSLERFEALETLVITHRFHYQLDAWPKSLRRLYLSDGSGEPE
jgi:hypothetical protein